MGNTLIQFIPKEGAQIVLVLFLSFLIGLEREEQEVISEQYRFGGVRTFPLLGLLGYALCLFSEGNPLLPAVGFAVVGAFLWQSYRHKLEGVALAGSISLKTIHRCTRCGCKNYRPRDANAGTRAPGGVGREACGVDHSVYCGSV